MQHMPFSAPRTVSFKTVARGVCISSLYFVLSAPVSAENLVEQRWREQKEAATVLGQSAARTEIALKTLAQVYVEMEQVTRRLEERNEAYIVILSRYYAVLDALEEQYKKRLLAQALPEFLIVTRDELKARRDAWISTQSSGNKPFREALQISHRDYVAAAREVSEAIETSNRTIAEIIDPEIQHLQVQKEASILELADLANVAYEADLTPKWFNAAQDLNEAEQQQKAHTTALEERHAEYVAALAEASPPFLQSIAVKAGGQIFYDFSWIREGYNDDVTASIEYARQREEIAEDLPNYTRIQQEISVERNLMHLDRWQLAIEMHAMSGKLVGLGDKHYSLERNQILATMFAEMGIAVAEAVLTGGAATAIRRGEELAEKKFLEAAASNKQLAGNIDETALLNVRDRLFRTVEETGRVNYDRLVETVGRQRASFVASELEEAVLGELRGQGHRFESLAEASENLLPATVNRLVRKASPAVESRAATLFPEVAFDELKGKVNLQRVLAAEEEILAGRATALASKSPDLYEAYSGNEQRALIRNPHTTDIREIFEGQAVEWAIGAGIDAGVEAKNLMFHSADLTGLKGVGRQAAAGLAFAALEGVVKAHISRHYEGKILETEAEYWSVFTQLAAKQQYYYLLTLKGGELAESENSYRNAISKMNVYLSEIGLPRRAGGEMPKAQPIPMDVETAAIDLTFSTPLAVAPVIHLGNTALQADGEGRQWRVTFEITPTHRKMGFAQLSVEAGPGNLAYTDLDTRPETIAYIPYDQPDWIGYERGADTRHIVQFSEETAEIPIEKPELDTCSIFTKDEISDRFCEGTAGWTVAGDVQNGTGLIEFKNGYVEAVDEGTGEIWSWVAPKRYSQNICEFIGGTLSYSIRQSDPEPGLAAPVVVIKSDQGELLYDSSEHPGTSWTGKSILLEPGPGWSGYGNAEAFQSILANATAILIRGEYSYTYDTGGLNEVSMKQASPSSTNSDCSRFRPK